MSSINVLRKEKGINIILRKWKQIGWLSSFIFGTLIVAGLILIIVTIFKDGSTILDTISSVQDSNNISKETASTFLDTTSKALSSLNDSVVLIKVGMLGLFITRIVVNLGLILRSYLDYKKGVIDYKPILISRIIFLSLLIIFTLLALIFLYNSVVDIMDFIQLHLNGAVNDIDVAKSQLNNLSSNPTPEEIEKIIEPITNRFDMLSKDFEQLDIMSKWKNIVKAISMLSVWGFVDMVYGIVTKVLFRVYRRKAKSY